MEYTNITFIDCHTDGKTWALLFDFRHGHDINIWFNVNKLTLILNKTYYIEFRTKNYYNVNTQIKYDQKGITNATETKFLGLITDDTLSWKQHIEYLVNKMFTACYAWRNIKHVVPIGTLRLIYFAHIHSIMCYSIILGVTPAMPTRCSYYKRKLSEL